MTRSKVPAVAAVLVTVKVAVVSEEAVEFAPTVGAVPLAGVTKDAVALRRLVPVIVTVDAAPPETPAVPVTLAICGPTSTPRPNGKVTVPLLSVKVTE